jgi:gluconate 2-dehydrogenase gamma chain
MWLYRPPESRFFGSEERAQVEALFEGILPATDDAPGATDVAAAEYLDRLLAMDESTYYEITGWKKLYKQALPALDAAAKAGFGGKALVDLSADERKTLLTQLSQGALAGIPAEIDQKKLFATIRAHCIEGCFADPRWGGNKERLMWRWYGYIEPARDVRQSHPVA